VLAASDRPLRCVEVHAAIAARLGRAVSKGSVAWCLWRGIRTKHPRFERVGYFTRRDTETRGVGPAYAQRSLGHCTPHPTKMQSTLVDTLCPTRTRTTDDAGLQGRPVGLTTGGSDVALTL
jgi:hypothetical protein